MQGRRPPKSGSIPLLTSPAYDSRRQFSSSKPLPLLCRSSFAPKILPISQSRLLKIHRQTTPQTPAAQFKRLYRNCPVERTRLNPASSARAVPIGTERLAGLVFRFGQCISVRRREATSKCVSGTYLESWLTRIDHLQLPSVFRDNLRSHLPVDAAS